MAGDPRQRYEDRVAGRARTGTVFLRHFDYGVATQLGGTIQTSPDGDPRFFVAVTGVTPAPGLPGVSIHFQNPDDAYQRWTVPYILIRRESPSLALNRRHAGATQYRAPADTAAQAFLRGVVGSTKKVSRPQALPVDLTYTLQLAAHKQTEVQALLQWVLGKFHVEGSLAVTDSIGDPRLYDAYLESMDGNDDIFDIGDRTMGFTVSIRVEGELDVYGENESPTVFTGLTPRVDTR